MSKIEPTVFIVEDDTAIAEGIAWLLKSVGINAELFPDGNAYLMAHDPSRQGCLVIDMRMPGMSGLELQARLNQQNNPIPVILITGHGDISLAVRAMQAGALNFLTKPFNDQIFLDEIQRAITISVNKAKGTNIFEHHNHYKSLSTREKVILKLIVDGKINKQIAQELEISNSTVELDRSNIMQKMKTKSLADLIKVHLLLESANLLE
jgi:FixJ family two-component response regulator